MKLFVTDAHLAGIRSTAAEAAWIDYRQTIAQHEREIARLREDRAAELARLADPQGPFVAHLTAEVAFWRGQVIHERQRAEIAIDTCRVTHLGVGPVTLPPRETQDSTPRATARDQSMFRNPEMAAMGLADGV